MYHSNKKYRAYKKQYRNKSSGCPFCTPLINDRRNVKLKEFNNFIIIENGVKYDYWEGYKVIEHLLLVPKEHIVSLSEMDSAQHGEMIKIISDYETLGYNIYARSVKSAARTVEHQHTHLILIEGKDYRVFMSMQKPYILFKF